MRTVSVAIVLSVFAVIGTSAVAIGLKESFAVRPGSSSLKVLLESNAASSTHLQDLEVEVVTLSHRGFDPPVLTRRRGPFLIAFQNESGEKDLLIRIARGGEGLFEVRVRPGRRNQMLRLDPPIGDYTISEAAHPAWACTLTITR